MPRLSNYVLRQLVGPVALFTFLLTAVVWLSQSLRLLDLVINRGQSAPTFLYLTFLLLPTLLVIILPIAFFGGTLYGLNKLNADSELVAMSAAGYSRWQLAAPVMAAALIDRLLHHCHIVNIRGNSYRMRQHRELAHRLASAQPRVPAPRTRRPALSPPGAPRPPSRPRRERRPRSPPSPAVPAASIMVSAIAL